MRDARPPRKTPAGALRAVLLIVATAGCAEVATVFGGVDGPASPPGQRVEAPAPPATTGARPSAGPRAAGEPEALAGITAGHNAVRARLGLPPLQWSPALAQVAQRWANACVDRVPPQGMIDHSAGRAAGFPGPLGENLYATTAPVADPRDAVDGWAGEAADYDYQRNACKGPMCGHYTQMVWRDTREVGCAVGSCPDLTYRSTLVCNYAPAGNVIGRRPY